MGETRNSKRTGGAVEPEVLPPEEERRYYDRLRRRIKRWTSDHAGSAASEVLLAGPDLFVLLSRLVRDPVGGRAVSIKTQPLQVQGEASSGGKKLAGGAMLGASIGAIADGGEGAAIGAAVGAGAGGAAAAGGSVDAAVIPAQKLQAFTVAVPFQVHVMTNVAVR